MLDKTLLYSILPEGRVLLGSSSEIWILPLTLSVLLTAESSSEIVEIKASESSASLVMYRPIKMLKRHWKHDVQKLFTYF